MTVTASKVCILIAALLFLLAAVGIGALGPLSLGWFGLFFLSLGFLAP